MSPAGYGFSVALHASALSVAGLAGVALIRRPQAKAAAILILLVVLSIAPWLLPVLRSRIPLAIAKPSAAVTETPVQVAPVLARLPVWTVASLPVESGPVLPPAGVTGTVAAGPAAFGAARFSAAGLYFAAAGLWLAGSMAGIIWLLGSGLRLGLWLHRLPELSDEQWLLVRQHLGGLEIPRSVFRISSDGRGPCVGGIFRPRIVLPLSLIGEKALAQQLRWTLAHESCHWEHGDSRWIWVVSLTRSLYWWNPIVHLLAGRWTAAREQVCDLQAGEGERTGYSSFLVKMASRASLAGGGLAVSMVRRQRSRSLRRRIVALLNASPADLLPVGRGFKLSMAGGLGALAVVLSGATIAEDAKPATAVQEKAPRHKKEELLWETPPPGEIPLPRPVAPAGPHRLAKLNFAVVYSTHDIIEERQVIPASEYEDFRNKVYSDPTNVVAELPAITTRDGGDGRMEFIREVIKPNAKEGSPRILGWRLKTAAHCENDRVQVTVKASYGFVPGHAFGTPDPQKIRWPEAIDSISEASTESSAAVGPGDILVTSLREVDEGCYATVLTMAVAVDATGRPTAPGPPSEQELTEKIRLTGEISTFPLSRKQQARSLMVQEMLLKLPELVDHLSRPADVLDGDLPAGIPFHPCGQPCIAAILPPSQQKPFSGATGPKEVLEPVVIVSGQRMKPWEKLNLELAFHLKRTPLGEQEILQLRPDDDSGNDGPSVPGQIWVIELKPLTNGTRRLLTLTAGKVQ